MFCQLIRATVAGLVLSTMAMMACGGVADSPEGVNLPSAASTSGTSEEVTISQERKVQNTTVPPTLVSTASRPEITRSGPEPTEPAQATNDDGQVEALVGEWEKDLTPIKQVSECVEQELGINRPLRPEDLQLQGNQPAIVACLKVVVGHE